MKRCHCLWEGRRTKAHKGKGEAQGKCVLREKEEGLQVPPEAPYATERVKWILNSCYVLLWNKDK